MRALWSLLLATSVFAASPSSVAQVRDAAAAEALFEEARKLAEEGRYAEACPKFAESNRLDPGVGILLYLGACHERLGEVASAWAAFREAREAAAAQGRADRVATADERIVALEPKLPRLRIVVPPDASIAGLEVLRDDHRLGEAMWGTAVPVDPRVYTIVARAPGYQPWEGTVQAKAGEVVSLEIPPLQLLREGPPTSTGSPTASPPPPTPSPDASRASGSTQRMAAGIVWGVGGASLIAGAAFGLVASSQWSDAKDHCVEGTTPLRCDAEGMAGIDDTETSGLLATILFATGGVAAAAGAVLWLTAPDDDGAAAGVGVDLRGVRAFGRF